MAPASVVTGITAHLAAPTALRAAVRGKARSRSSVARIAVALALAAAASGPLGGGAYAEVHGGRRAPGATRSVNQSPTQDPARTRIARAISSRLLHSQFPLLQRWGRIIATSAQRPTGTAEPSPTTKSSPGRSIAQVLPDEQGGYVPGLYDMFNSH